MTIKDKIVIIGAGISGLYIGIELLRAGYRNITIYEKYNYVGGRIVTINREKEGLQYEIGAARIHREHRMVRDLMRRYGLRWSSLSDAPSLWVDVKKGIIEENRVEDEMGSMLGPLLRLDAEMLATNTIADLLASIHGKRQATKFIERFPYYTEMHFMRADIALVGFLGRDGYLGTRSGFGIVRGGLSSLVRCMRDEFEGGGGKLILGWTAVAIDDGDVTLRDGDNNLHLVQPDKIICALHASALKRIGGLNEIFSRELRHLRMAPLVRIYAQVPGLDIKRKIVTNGPLRYIIPVIPEKNLIMISYTDGGDTAEWARGEKPVRGWEKKILSEMRELGLTAAAGPTEPTFMKSYPWADGTTYWAPGNYDIETVAERLMFGLAPRLYICGESLSVGKQAWMEGALETAEKVVRAIIRS
jgi:hypothetical protein